MPDQIQNVLHRIEGRQLSEPVPNEGPAVYQEKSAYLAAIDQNLAAEKDKRSFQNDFDKKERKGDLKTRAGIGMGVIATASLLITSGGGPNRILKNIETFPQHVAYLFNGNTDTHLQK